MTEEDIGKLTTDPDAPANFTAEKDRVIAASKALRGLYE
jgi:hypothetical protein